MIAALKNIIPKSFRNHTITEKPSVEAYDIWSENYDAQPGNLMLDMDEQLFAGLLLDLDLQNKNVADIGCGTGRHWHKLFNARPSGLTGFDVSQGMLDKLNKKFPEANTIRITDNLFSNILDATFDIIVSTLTVAHIHNIEEALQSWCRMLKPYGDIIITDFHPNALAHGGQRTFKYNNTQIAIENFVHYVYDIEEILIKYGFHIVRKDEKIIDESVRHYYEAKNAIHVYDKFKDSRIIYGLHLRREA